MDGLDLSKLDPALLDYIPAHMPPDGVTPNFIDPPSQANIVAITIYVTLPMMVVTVFLRFFTRFYIGQKLEADDFLCVVATLSTAGYCGVVLALLDNPIGIHQWNISISKVTTTFLERSLVSQCMYVVSALWVKVTLLVFYLRLFTPSLRANIMIWGGIAVCFLFYTICIIVNLANCVPVSRSLPVNAGTGRNSCSQPQLRLSAAHGAFGVITDFYVLTIPMGLVLKLRLPLKRKIGVSALFLTGLLACAASVASCVYRFRQTKSSDYMWDSVPVYALGAVELNVGLICACIPVVFVLTKKITSIPLWVSIQRYIDTRRSRRTQQKNSNDDPPNVDSIEFMEDVNGSGQGAEKGGNKLPKIPKATLTGLRSFIRRAHRTQADGSRDHGHDGGESGVLVRTELTAYSELASVDEDYHAQLRGASRGTGNNHGSSAAHYVNYGR